MILAHFPQAGVEVFMLDDGSVWTYSIATGWVRCNNGCELLMPKTLQRTMDEAREPGGLS